MTEEQFERAMDRYELDSEYSEFIAKHTSIGNGHQLIAAIEAGDWYESFKEHMVGENDGA